LIDGYAFILGGKAVVVYLPRDFQPELTRMLMSVRIVLGRIVG
jgi:hypothetical protein